jgi:hypothetical protein
MLWYLGTGDITTTTIRQERKVEDVSEAKEIKRED